MNSVKRSLTFNLFTFTIVGAERCNKIHSIHYFHRQVESNPTKTVHIAYKCQIHRYIFTTTSGAAYAIENLENSHKLSILRVHLRDRTIMGTMDWCLNWVYSGRGVAFGVLLKKISVWRWCSFRRMELKFGFPSIQKELFNDICSSHRSFSCTVAQAANFIRESCQRKIKTTKIYIQNQPKLQLEGATIGAVSAMIRQRTFCKYSLTSCGPFNGTIHTLFSNPEPLSNRSTANDKI